MTEYFSDKELGEKQPIIEEISTDVWNGIVAIFEEYKTNNYFSFSFPEKCHDNNSLIVGFNEELFNDRVKAEIPNLIIPVERKQIVNDSSTGWNIEETTTNDKVLYVDKYPTLDFIEFLCRNFKTPLKKDYHDFFKHYHLGFEDDFEQKRMFREKLNQLFQRNGIVYILEGNCQIIRSIPKELTGLIKNYKTNDERLNVLINNSIEKLKSVKFEERLIALQMIWDAFERMKTYYTELKKKQSIEKLLELASEGNTDTREELNKEANELTRIGNEFEIRHSETDKKQIKPVEFIDFLFFRMLSFINLIVVKLENNRQSTKAQHHI
jgi:hypothetical protein